MNKIFRVVWNAATGNWVAVSELAKRVSSKSQSVAVSASQPVDIGTVEADSTVNWKLTGIATAFLFAGMLFCATTARAEVLGPIATGSGIGVAIHPSHGDCADGSKAGYVHSVSIGCGAVVSTEKGAITVERKNPYDHRGVQVGINSNALDGTGAVAIGEYADAARGATVVGGRAKAGINATAIGPWALADGTSSSAIGNRSWAKSNASLAVGREAIAVADFSQALGNVSLAEGLASFAVGHSTLAKGKRAIAIGSADTETSAESDGAVYYRPLTQTRATGELSVAIGGSAVAEGLKSIAIGASAKADKGNAALVWRGNPYDTRVDESTRRPDVRNSEKKLGPVTAVVVGQHASGKGAGVAVGGRAESVASSATAIGAWALAQGGSASAIGARSWAKGTSSLAVGREAVAEGAFSQSLGNVSAATGKASLAIGHSTIATGDRSIAIGSADPDDSNEAADVRDVHYRSLTQTKATGKGAVAIGASARSEGEMAAALGAGAQADRANAVALGSGSDTMQAATAVRDATVGGVFYDGFTGVVTNENRVVSVGAAGAERQIKNVGAGDISATSTDAINGSQLHAVMTKASSGWGLQANGDTASKVAPGETVQFLDGNNINVTRNGNDITIATAADLTADSLTIADGPFLNGNGIAMGDKKITGLADGTAPNDAVNFSQLDGVKTTADNALTQAGNALTEANNAFTEASKGWNLQANGDTASKVAPGDTVQFLDGSNINVTRNGNDITIATAADLTADSLTIADGPFLNGNGIAMGDKKITGLADGTAPKDAVNVSQLDGVKTVADNALTQAGNALTEASKGWNLQLNDEAASKVAPGDTVKLASGENIAIAREGDAISITTVPDLAADSLTINNGGPVFNVDGINMNDKKLTNVAPGTLSADSKDGVNASQLFAVGNSTANSLGGDSKFDPDTGVVTTSLNVGDKTFTTVNDALGDLNTTLASTTAAVAKGWNLQANGDAASKVAPGDTVQFLDGDNINVTRNGNDITIATAADLTVDSLTIADGPFLNGNGIAMGDTKITGLADGTAPKDAVNVSQLDGVKTVADNALTQAGNALTEANNALTEASKGWNLQLDDEAASKVAPGDTLKLAKGSNIAITRDGETISIATVPELTADSLTINNGGPVISSAGIDMKGNKLNDVGAGTLSSDSKDSVNASQLFAVGNSTASALGGNSTFNPETGVVAASLKVGDNSFTTVNDALADLKTSLTNAEGTASLGWNLQLNDDAAGKVAPGDTVKLANGSNIAITKDGEAITIATTPELTADKLTIGNGGPVISSTGIDLSGNKLSNVGAGTLSADSKDGVNAGQLFAVGDSTASALGGDSVFDPVTGKVQAGLKVGGQVFNSVNGALDAINSNVSTIAQRGWDIADASGIVGAVATGEQVKFVAADSNTKVSVSQDNGVSTVSVSTAASPLQYAQTANANGQNEVVADPFGKTNSVTLVGQDQAAPVSLNNVAKAKLSADSLQAVNGQQLYGLGQSIASTLGGDTYFNAETGQLNTTIRVGDNSYNNVADALSGIGEVAGRGWQLQLNNDAPQKVAGGATVGFNQGRNIELSREGNQITVATAPNVTFESVEADRVQGDTISAKSYLGVIDGPALTPSGIDGAGKLITNVKPGEIAEGSTDAVTGGQLHSLAGNTANAINRLQGDLSRVARDADAGSATAGAMANLPQAYLPGKSMFALATARYAGQQGFAAGLSTVSDNGKWILKGSVSGNTRGKTMVGAGVGYQW